MEKPAPCDTTALAISSKLVTPKFSIRGLHLRYTLEISSLEKSNLCSSTCVASCFHFALDMAAHGGMEVP